MAAPRFPAQTVAGLRQRRKADRRICNDSEDMPTPDVPAQEIADDLEASLEQFITIVKKLKG
jgi:hypothetical protein